MCVDSAIDPSMLEYERHLPIGDSERFNSELLLNSVPGDNVAFQSQTAIVLATFYKVYIEIILSICTLSALYCTF